MTVIRRDSEEFNAPEEHVFAAVLRVLQKGQQTYSYVDTVPDESSGQINTRIKPMLWPLMLSTKLDIRVEGCTEGARVAVETRSQWYILADIVGFYRTYIRDFMRSLPSEIRNERGIAE